MTGLWIIGAVLFASFGLIVFRGAPFVPTRARDLDALFEISGLQKSDTIVDLGSGDGRVLEAAAKRGMSAIGYELNPFLVWYSRLRLRRFSRVDVRLKDFWTTSLPDETAVVFVFLAGPYMAKLDRKMEHETERLGHDILLVSYGMKIPNRTPETTSGGLLLYRYKP